MKKIISAILLLAILMSSTSVYADTAVANYLNYDNLSSKVVLEQLPDDFITINSNNCNFTKMTSNWYLVEESCTIGNVPVGPFTPGGVEITGEVHIVICSGVTLTVQGGFGTERYGNMIGQLYVHGVKNGQCNLEIIGMVPEKPVLSSFRNYALGQGIDLKEFYVCGCNVTIKAATGFKGTAPLDASGKEGYAAIKNTHVMIYNSTVKVYGGNGGDSAEKRAYLSKNNGGNGGCALYLSSVYMQGSTLELYGGDGGKHLGGSGVDGQPGDSCYSTSIHTDNVIVCNAKTGEKINLDNLNNYQSVTITNQSLTASVLSNGSLAIIAALLIIFLAVLILTIKRKRKA